MKCLQRFFTLSAVFAICLSLCITCYAEELDDSSDYYSFQDDFSADLGDDLLEYSGAVYDLDNPLPVVVVDDAASYSVRSGRAGSPVLVIGDTPPDSPLFYGSGWVSGYDSSLGDITIYFPIDTQIGHWGVDANGYLYNITSGSISGYLSGVYNNSVSASAFSYPRYRTSSSASYTTLYLTPENSNMDIATTNVPRVPVSQALPYVTIFLLGVILLCFMKRS